MKITQSFKKYGWSFELYKSEYLGEQGKNKNKVYKAIYIGSCKESKRSNIEVVILKERRPNLSWGETEGSIAYPSTEEWGKKAWSYMVLEKAEEKYKQISLKTPVIESQNRLKVLIGILYSNIKNNEKNSDITWRKF